MITLRQNQVEPHRIGVEFFRQTKDIKPSLLVLPTAFGKSILVAKIAADIQERILILQPSKELLEQNYGKFVLNGGMAAIYSASFGQKNIRTVTFATIGSIKSIGAEFKRLGFTKMIVDEADRYPRNADSMIGTFLADSGIVHVLGLTATPFKSQQNRDLESNTFTKFMMLTSQSKKGTFYKEILYVSQIKEIVELGFWSKLVYEKANQMDYELKWNSSKSDYTEESIAAAFELCNTFGKIVTAIRDNSERKKIIVFVPRVADAQSLAAITPNSAAVWGTMDAKERDKTIKDFKEGSLRIVYNVSVLSVGFDSPNIDWIILGRDFGSLSQYYQIVGRGTRILEGKEDCLITDFGKNIDRFGRVEGLHFEKEKLTWKLYGEDGQLMTGIPMHEIGSVVRKDPPIQIENAPIGETLFTFGKHKDVAIKDIPESYLKWCLENVTWNKWNINIKIEIERFLNNNLVKTA